VTVGGVSFVALLECALPRTIRWSWRASGRVAETQSHRDMKRIFALVLVAVFALAAGIFVWKSRRASDPASQSAAVKADSVWYHASDVALLAKTGRPQLVEFFHPN